MLDRGSAGDDLFHATDAAHDVDRTLREVGHRRGHAADEDPPDQPAAVRSEDDPRGPLGSGGFEHARGRIAVPDQELRDDAGGMIPAMSLMSDIRLVVAPQDAEAAREVLEAGDG